MKFENIEESCFRPLIGVNFCKPMKRRQLKKIATMCFRPLIGVNFCKLDSLSLLRVIVS